MSRSNAPFARQKKQDLPLDAFLHVCLDAAGMSASENQFSFARGVKKTGRAKKRNS
jgi:hypothetical protein